MPNFALANFIESNVIICYREGTKSMIEFFKATQTFTENVK